MPGSKFLGLWNISIPLSISGSEENSITGPAEAFSSWSGEFRKGRARSAKNLACHAHFWLWTCDGYVSGSMVNKRTRVELHFTRKRSRRAGIKGVDPGTGSTKNGVAHDRVQKALSQKRALYRSISHKNVMKRQKGLHIASKKDGIAHFFSKRRFPTRGQAKGHGV